MLDAAIGLGGLPIACLRVSFADPRERHRGRVAPQRDRAHDRDARPRARSRCRASAASTKRILRADLASTGLADRHELVDVAADRHRRLCSRRSTCTSCRWAGPPPTIRCCSRPPPPRASSPQPRRDRSGRASGSLPRWPTLRRASNASSTCSRCCSTRRCRAPARSSCARSPAIRPNPRRTAARSSATRRSCAAWACRSRWRPSATAPRSATASAPTTTACPISGSRADETAALRVAVSAVSLGDQTGQGALMKLGGVGDQTVGADRVAADRARARDAVRGVPAPRRRAVHVPRRDAHARTVGTVVEARPLVRRRLRPRPRRGARVPRRPHRRRRRGRRSRRVRGARRLPRRRSHRRPRLAARRRAAGDGAPRRRRRPRSKACSARSGSEARIEPDATDATATPVVEVTVTNRAAFRSFVLGFLEHAEILDPPDVRAEMIEWLEAVAAGRRP